MGGQKLQRSYFEQILIQNFVSVPCHNRKQVTRLKFLKNMPKTQPTMLHPEDLTQQRTESDQPKRLNL